LLSRDDYFPDKHRVLSSFGRSLPPVSGLESALTYIPGSVHSKGHQIG
jgi:hypothetical protein